ncbi:MAG: RimJ/RimL family protein N-acetyltransferase [Phenylobacterium sp.]|jgi:RimJ/RimL family protein N-acetyltransferase
MHSSKQALAAFINKQPLLNPEQTVAEPAPTPEPNEWVIAPLSAAPQDSPLAGVDADSLEFAPFLRAALWQQQSDYFIKQGPAAWQQHQPSHDITDSPTMVNAWAKLVLNYLMDGLHNGAIDPEQPIQLLELGAGSGRFAIQMLRCLETLFEQYGLDSLDFCYLASDISEKNVQFMAGHIGMQQYLQTGKAKVLVYDVLAADVVADVVAGADADGHNVELQNALTGGNPLLVVANALFGSLPQTLVYLHYGELYQGEVALGAALTAAKDDGPFDDPFDGPFEALALYYRWQKQPDVAHWLQSQPESVRAFLTAQLDHYLSHLNSQPLLLPVGALECLTRLQQQSPQGMLLLMADFGQKDQQAVSRMDLPDLRVQGSFSLPVNFDCINRWLAAKNGLIHSVQHRSDGLLLNVAVLDEAFLGETVQDKSKVSNGAYVLTRQISEQVLSGFNPDDFFQVKRSLHGAKDVLSEAQQLAYIRLSAYDPQVLALFFPVLLAQGVAVDARVDWCELLGKVWQNYVPIGERGERDEQGEQGQFAFKLGLLAIDLSHWSLAKACFISCLEWVGPGTAVLHNLALVARATADNALAAQSIELALDSNPQDQQAKRLAEDIKTIQHNADQLNWFDSSVAQAQQLKLQPLAQHHGIEFSLQYRDRQIASLARSYLLDTPEQVGNLISHWQQENSRASYAVIHPVFGLVGCVGLEFHRDNLDTMQSASFSFWIGADYQGMGFGQLAAQLCIAQARVMADKQGLQFLMTSAWLHNRRSLHVLSKVGFIEFDLNQGEEDEQGEGVVAVERVFYLPLIEGAEGLLKIQASKRYGLAKCISRGLNRFLSA